MNKYSIIQLADRLNCTGCASCAQSCPHSAIEMMQDEEGFLQPIINRDLCVECGLCMKRCPMLNPISISTEESNVYALINYKDRAVSSSGGAFSVFADYVIEKGGVVFGAAIDDDFQVMHIGVEDEKNLTLLRGSKYVQSKIGNSYKQAREFLKQGRLVLFTGTPCQIAGLYAFLGKERYEENLITIDLVCHGVPSQGGFDAYIDKLKKTNRFKGENIKEFRFRKLDSWSIIPAVKLAESKWHTLNVVENAYMSAFFCGLTFRESCFRCKYCNTQRVGTFTIADFWGIGRHGKKFYRNVACGISLVIDNKKKLLMLSKDFPDDVYIERRTMEEAVAEQSNLIAPMQRSKKRDFTVKSLINPNDSLEDFLRICGLPYKSNWINRVKSAAKSVIYALGLYNVYKTIIYKMGK